MEIEGVVQVETPGDIGGDTRACPRHLQVTASSNAAMLRDKAASGGTILEPCEEFLWQMEMTAGVYV